MKNRYSPAESRFLKQIGNNIVSCRKKIGISQEKLALQSELDRSYMGRIERGKNNATSLTLKRIADTLEIEVLEFFKIKGK